MDISDGHLEEQKASYRSRLSTVKQLHMTNKDFVVGQLCGHFDALQKDKEFYILVSICVTDVSIVTHSDNTTQCNQCKTVILSFLG